MLLSISPGRRAALALVATVGLAVGLTQAVSPVPAAAKSPSVQPYLGQLVEGHNVPALPARSQPAAPAPVKEPAPLPAAGSFPVTLPATGPWQALGSTGLAVAAAPEPGHRQATSRARVEVLSAAEAGALGLSGLVLRLSRADGLAGTASVRLRIPDGVLAGRFGGDYASRLRWVQLPGTSTAAAVHQGSVRPAPVRAAATPTGTVLDTQLSAQPVLLTATAAPLSASGSGTWAATSLKSSGSWQVATQSGSFEWNYPLRVPPAAAGPTPALSLAYSSGSIDGETASTNNQSSVIGDGWQLAGSGFIERSFARCSEDGTGLTGSQATSADLCWNGENDTISFAGHAGLLVPMDQTDTQYRIQGDDGSRVEHLKGSANCANPTAAVDCWRLTTQDGTQYYFGKSAGSAATWTVPVFSDDSGEPCYKGAFSTTSACTTAWRWNLDYVMDLHGSSEKLLYKTESNYYHANGGSLVSYVRSGYLTEIDYGIAPGGTTPSDKVILGYDTYGRCSDFSTRATTCTSQVGPTYPAPSHPTEYPDVPWDQNCLAGGTCTGLVAPTFWTSQMLNTVTTQALVGTTWTTADTWTLKHEFVSSGDTSAASMWLSAVSRPGLPNTTFGRIALNNRVDATTYVLLSKQRLNTITLDTGGIVTVSYGTPDCTATLVKTLNPAGNSHQCFPQWWTPPGKAPLLDWFHKYRVISVKQSPVTGGTKDLATETDYVYTSNPAWRLDTSAATPDARRTWSAFAGYSEIEVRTGDPNTPSAQQTVDYRYLQGLDGDPDNSGASHTGTRNVTVTAGTQTVTDSLWWAGRLLETTVRIGANGGTGRSSTPVVSDTVVLPWAQRSAAHPVNRGFKDPTPGLASPASYTVSVDAGSYLTGDAVVSAGSAVSTGGLRTVTTTTSHDGYGRVTSVQTDTPDAGSTCTTTSYATDPTGLTDTKLWLLELPSRITVVGLSCTGTPSYPDDAVSDTRYFYDGATSPTTQSLTYGDLTETDQVSGYSGSTPTWQVIATTPVTGYDSLGRLLAVTNALGVKTTTSYTPAAAGPMTSSTVTSAFGTGLALATTTSYSPLWGSPTASTDANGNLTTASYDSLGRLSKVWLPDRPVSAGAHTGNPSLAYTYTVAAGAAVAVQTQTLNSAGNQISTYAFYDGLGRPIQTQEPMDSLGSGGIGHVVGGTVLTDTYYDPAGRVYLVDNPYGTTSVTPGPTLFAASTATQVPNQSQTRYDGAGRKTADVWLGNSVAGGTLSPLWETDYGYPGADRTDTTPPAGGTATSRYTDSRGRVTALDQYLGGTPAGTAQRTSYSYDARGDLTGMTDPAGNSWSWRFDVRGRQVQAVDPDTGTTTSGYDAIGELTQTVDGAGTTLRYSYDALGRKTQLQQQLPNNGGLVLLASWAYDTAALGKGLPAGSTSYVGSTAGVPGTPYDRTVGSYDPTGKPLTASVVVPNWNGASTPTSFDSYYFYDQAGQLSAEIQPGGQALSDEYIAYTYDLLNNLTAVGGDSQYLGNVVFSHYNRPVQFVDTDGNGTVNHLYTYDDATTRLTEQQSLSSASSNANLADHHYQYTDSGLLTSDSNVAAGQPTDTQCYRYDGLQELTAAWTPAGGDCAAAPSATSLGGPAPYWTSYGYDTPTGNRTNVIQHATTSGGTDRRAIYTYPGSRPHAVTGIATSTAPAGGSTWTPAGSSSYGYDAAGRTTTRPGQTLDWDAQGRLAAVHLGSTATGNVYDAEGNLLLATDPAGGKTLYLGATELRVAAGSSTVTGVRTYAAYGQPIAERSTNPGAPATSSMYWLDPRPLGQNTADEEANAATLVASHRYLDPFGNPRGSSVSWTSSHGFLNQPSNPDTATTHLGVRDYDPALGRFLSADPLLDPNDPQQAEGYGYAGNDPVNRSDPSGAMANKFLGDTPTCEPLCHGESSGSIPGANGSTITITSTGQVTVTYGNGVAGGDLGGRDNVNGVTIPTTRHTHVQIAAFTEGFSARLPHYLRESGHDPTGSVYQLDRTELRNALMEYCTTVPDCQENDIWSGGASGLKGIIEAAAVGAPFAAGGVAGIIGSSKQPVGDGIRTRAIDYTPKAADSNWGLTRAHLDKHMFGSGKSSLSRIDPHGNSDIWFGYMQDLASRPATATLKGGIEDIMGTFPRTGGGGTFQFGIRVAPNGSGGYDLVTLLTRQP